MNKHALILLSVISLTVCTGLNSHDAWAGVKSAEQQFNIDQEECYKEANKVPPTTEQEAVHLWTNVNDVEFSNHQTMRKNLFIKCLKDHGHTVR